jgi:hypothetical protein
MMEVFSRGRMNIYTTSIELFHMKSTLEVNLRAEIDFWRSLIDEWKNTQTGPVHLRIEEALALAEYKLKKHEIASSNAHLH